MTRAASLKAVKALGDCKFERRGRIGRQHIRDASKMRGD